LRYEDGLDFYVLPELQGQIIYLNSSDITSSELPYHIEYHDILV